MGASALANDWRFPAPCLITLDLRDHQREDLLPKTSQVLGRDVLIYTAPLGIEPSDVGCLVALPDAPCGLKKAVVGVQDRSFGWFLHMCDFGLDHTSQTNFLFCHFDVVPE